MSLTTVRINELPALTVGLDLALADKIPIWIASENKTRKVTLQDLNTYFATGGGSTHPPVVYGGELIYEVPSGHAGTDTAPIPTIAGLDFTLERSGLPMIALLPDNSNSSTAEYEVLDSGGFKLLKSGDVLALGERFKLILFTLIGGSGGGGGTTTTNFIKGVKNIPNSLSIDPAQDFNKIGQCRAGATAITATLPLVEDIAENGFIVFDTLIGQTKPVRIQTAGGQYIYMNSTSRTFIDLMPGEICWLYRGADGFYVLDQFGEKYKDLAMPKASYKAGLNQLVCKGQELLRSEYPRLWEFVQTLGSSLVSKSTWDTAQVYLKDGTFYTSAPAAPYRTILKPYRGCYHTGDGSTTFGIPDLMNQFLRGVKSETGSDAERYLNKPGGYQDGTVKVDDGLKALKVTGTFTYQTGDSSPSEPNLVTGYDISTGIETRPEDVGVLWVINA